MKLISTPYCCYDEDQLIPVNDSTLYILMSGNCKEINIVMIDSIKELIIYLKNIIK
jgi:hypothetical protein